MKYSNGTVNNQKCNNSTNKEEKYTKCYKEGWG